MTHNVVLCMRQPTRRAAWLLNALDREFGGDVAFHLNFQGPPEMELASRFGDRARFYETPAFVRRVAESSGVDVNALRELVANKPTMRRFLLLCLLRWVHRLDYCLLIGDDIVLMDRVSELVGLSAAKRPFVVPDAKTDFKPDTSTEDSVCRFLDSNGFQPRYYRSIEGCGYSSDFIGLDLTVLDRLNSKMLAEVCGLELRWLEQALLVWLNFCSVNGLKVFGPGDRYWLQKYNDYRYPKRSRVYHAGGTNHKSACFFAYLYRRIGCWPLCWLALRGVHFLPEAKGVAMRVLRRAGLYDEDHFKYHRGEMALKRESC